MGEVITIIGAVGVVTGIYFKIRQARREADPDLDRLPETAAITKG